MKKRIDLIQTIVNLIIIITAIIAIYWLILLILGNSPPLSQVNAMFIIMIVGILFTIYREIEEIKVGMKHGFSKIKEDIVEIKNNINLIKKKLKI